MAEGYYASGVAGKFFNIEIGEIENTAEISCFFYKHVTVLNLVVQ